jgi:hypothetical protein
LMKSCRCSFPYMMRSPSRCSVWGKSSVNYLIIYFLIQIPCLS